MRIGIVYFKADDKKILLRKILNEYMVKHSDQIQSHNQRAQILDSFHIQGLRIRKESI